MNHPHEPGVACPSCGHGFALPVAWLTSMLQQYGLRIVPADPARSGPPSTAGRGRTPMTPDQAAAYRLPLGRHKGKTLQEVDQIDRPWIAWASATLDGQAGEACRVFRTARKAAAPEPASEPTIEQDDEIPAPY